MYIPDPIERMESRIDRLAFEWNELQRDVPAGSFRCPDCKQIRSGEPIQASPHPDSSATCYECLSPGDKQAYDDFEVTKGGHMSLSERLSEQFQKFEDANRRDACIGEMESIHEAGFLAVKGRAEILSALRLQEGLEVLAKDPIFMAQSIMSTDEIEIVTSNGRFLAPTLSAAFSAAVEAVKKGE